jgi:sugar lactone lactonase YvrE
MPVVLLLLFFKVAYPLHAQVISTVAGPGNKIYNSNDSSFEILNAITNPNGIAVDDSGNVYIGEYYDAGELLGSIFKFRPNDNLNTPGGAVTRGSSVNILLRPNHLSYPHGVAIDKSGNIYVAEYNSHMVRKITPAGKITTIAGNGTAGYSGDNKAATLARLSLLNGIAVDNYGNIFIADEINHAIRKVNADGMISTYAGTGEDGYRGDEGPAKRALLNRPYGVAVDNEGNVFFADSYNNVIRKVNSDGIISTIAGNGKEGDGGDGGPATDAMLNKPAGIAVDAFGNLFIADEGNNVVRRVTSKGIIKTVAGNGRKGYLGDGRLAVNAELSGPTDVAIDHKGNLYIADFGNHVIRKVVIPLPVILPHAAIPSLVAIPPVFTIAYPVIAPPVTKKVPIMRPAPVPVSPVSVLPLSTAILAPEKAPSPVAQKVPVMVPEPVPISSVSVLPLSITMLSPEKSPPPVTRRLSVMVPAPVPISSVSVLPLSTIILSPEEAPLPVIKKVPVMRPSAIAIAPLHIRPTLIMFLPPVTAEQLDMIPPLAIMPPPEIEEDKVTVSVNTDNILTIKTEKGTYTSFSITNMTGEKMLEKSLKAKQTDVDLKGLPPGYYYINLKAGNETKILRFVKEN